MVLGPFWGVFFFDTKRLFCLVVGLRRDSVGLRRDSLGRSLEERNLDLSHSTAAKGWRVPWLQRLRFRDASRDVSTACCFFFLVIF